MPWTTPVSPVAGTVITVAWATANVVNPQIWLRLMTGNADPPGASYVVVSSSPSSTAWGKVTSDVIADGAITTLKLLDFAVTNVKLAPGTAALNLAGTTINGVVTIAGSGAGLVIHGTAGLLNDGAAGTTLSGPGPITLGGTGGVFVSNTAGIVVSGAAGLAVSGTNGLSVTSSGGVSVTNTLNAGTLQQGGAGVALASHVQHAGSLNMTSGQTLNFPDVLGNKIVLFTGFGIGVNSGQAVLFAAPGNEIAIRDSGYNGTFRGNVVHTGSLPTLAAGTVVDGGITTPKIADDAVIASKIAANAVGTTEIVDNAIIGSKILAGVLIGPHFNSAYNDGLPASPSIRTLGTGGQQAAAGDHTHAGALVPSGMIAGFRTAANIPSGWARCNGAGGTPNMDGRVPVGAGTTSGTAQTFAENAAAGAAAWPHAHVSTGLGASSTFTGTPSATGDGSSLTQQSNVTTPNPAVSTSGHTHAYTPAGSVTTTLSGQVGDTTWIPPSFAVVWAIKL